MIFVDFVIYVNADWLPRNEIPAQSFPPPNLPEVAVNKKAALTLLPTIKAAVLCLRLLGFVY